MTNVKKHIELLGQKAKDKVTGFKGVIDSVCFDLYGCIQVLIAPEVKDDNKKGDSYWYDVNRVTILSKKPVMNVPNFDYGDISEGKKGPAHKPNF